VTGVIEYARCPKRFYWSAVRPLPRFSGPAARVGTQVHRWIELRSRGQASLLEDDDVPDLTAEELAGGTGTVDRLRRTFQDSRFAGEVPLFAERPFLLRLGDFMVGGRIDAIYPLADGRWEVVDYKTGRVPSTADAIANLQLDLYALACVDIWGKRPDDLVLTYLYLSTGDVVTHGVDDVGDVRARILRSLGELASGRFEPTPGAQCHWCDFLPFCPAGRAFVDAVEHAR
jgi:DNA helicase II / ATP-dependent DNA helicase PcrA